MLTSITPLGERGRRRRWGLTTAWYVAGSTAGGAAVGVLAGGLAIAVSGISAGPRALLVIGALACACGSSERRAGHPAAVVAPAGRRDVAAALPRLGGRRRLRDPARLRPGDDRVECLGLRGARLAVLTGSFWAAVAVGTTFGLVRALPLLSVRGVRSTEALASLHRRVSAIAPRARVSTLAVLTGGAIALGLVAAGVS